MRIFDRRTMVFWAFVGLLLTIGPEPKSCAQAPTAAQFEVKLDPNVSSEPLTGRLFVFLSEKSRRAPRSTIEWFSPEPFLALDVVDFAPGEIRVVDSSAIGFPDRLPTLPDGKYYIHALLAHSDYDGDPGRAVGNLFSQPIQHELRQSENSAIELTLNQKVPAKQPRLQPWTERIEVPCPMLGEFHGREHLEPALVLLPPSYSSHPERRYPVMYCVPSFNITHLDTRHCLQLTGPMEAKGSEVEFIRVILSGQGPWGHHSYANGATNGPRADSLVQEFIPYIDEHYRTVSAPTARFLTGHSSGGWSSLWLQIQYPQTFGGVWSSAPDPVDFRSYQGINLYADPPQNVYVTGDGLRRRLSRAYRNTVLFWDSFTRMDDAYGRGGQLRAFEAVFSPLDSSGNPAKVFDRETGLVDPVVAEQWKAYDIRHVLQNDWESLREKLDGKIHLLIGNEDTFFLNEAVDYLLEGIPEFVEVAEVERLDGRTHMNTLTEQRSRRLRRQLSETFLESHREAYGESSARTADAPATAPMTFVQNRIQSSDGKTLDLKQSDDSRTRFAIPFSVSDSDMADIAKMQGLSALNMPGATELTDRAIQSLRGLSGLVELDLSWTKLTDASAPHLASFPKLRKLTLAGTMLGDSACERLGHLETLQEINLRSTQITSTGLLQLSKLPNLKTLDVSGNDLKRDGLERFVECRSLETLRLQAAWLDESDIQPLLNHPTLKELDLSGNLISSSSVAAMQQQLADRGSKLKIIHSYSPLAVDTTLPGAPVVSAKLSVYQSAGAFSDLNLKTLMKHSHIIDLDLRGAQISDVGLSKLLGFSPWHRSVRKLNLQGLKASPSSIESLMNFEELIDLSLIGVCPVGDATDVLVNLPRLVHLNLQDCDVTDVGVAKLQGLRQLDYLALTNSKQVTDKCLPYLKNLRDLRYLYIRGTGISADGVQALRRALPACFVYGDPRKWEYKWPNPNAVVGENINTDSLPALLSTARTGRVLIDSSRCDSSWWLGQQPTRFDDSRNYHARSSLNMLRQRGYEVDLVKPGEKLVSDELSSYDVIIRQRPWLAEDPDTIAAYRNAVEKGSRLILELSPGYVVDTLADSLGLAAEPTQQVKQVARFIDEPLGRALRDHYGPFCAVETSTEKARAVAWLDERQGFPVAGTIRLGKGSVYFVGGPIIDSDRTSPLVKTVDGLIDRSLQRDATAGVVAYDKTRGPSIVTLDAPSADEVLPQPTSGSWRFQCTPADGVRTSQVIIIGPSTVSLRSREVDFRDRDHIHNIRLSYLEEIPAEQAARWSWQARARSIAGEWGPWSEPRAIRVAPTSAEVAALRPPEPMAPETVPGMHTLPIGGSQSQFLGNNRFLALSYLGKYSVFYLDLSGPKLVTDETIAYGFGGTPYIFADGKWLIHLQPKSDQEANATALVRNQNVKKQPLLMELDDAGQVMRKFDFDHSDSVHSRYIVLNRWLVTRSQQDNRLWDLTAQDPTKNFITIEPPQNQHKMEPFRIDGRWMLAGDQLVDLSANDPQASARRLPVDAATQVYFSPNDRWLVKGHLLVDLEEPDWSSAVHLLPTASVSEPVTFSENGRWLQKGTWLVDLSLSSPEESAVRLGIDDRTNVIRFSPDNRWLFATSPERIQVWDLMTDPIDESMRQADGPGGGGYGFGPANFANIAFSHDRRWATVTSYAGNTLIFDMDAAKLEPHTALENQNSYMSLNWSRDSRWLLSGNSNGMKITDLHAPPGDSATKTIAELGNSAVRGVSTIRLSPNRRWLCFTRHRRFNSSNAAIKLWDLESKAPLESEIELPVPLGFNGSFSPDSRWLAIPSLRTPGSGGSYQSAEDLILFDLTAANIAGSALRLPTHKNSIRETRFSSDGHWLVTSDTKEARLFDLRALLGGRGDAAK